MNHARQRRCVRPCCSRDPYRPLRHVPASPIEPARRSFGLGLFLVLVLLLIGAIASSFDDQPVPACGQAPPNAFRSAGWWYSGATAVAPVDPYNPDCYPKP